MTPDLLFAEDIEVGLSVDLGTVVASRAEIVEFAQRFDPLPFHVDPDASPFGDVIASSIHTLALFASVASPGFIARLAIAAGKGMERLRLPHPVRPDAVLRASMEVTDVVRRDGRADIHCQCRMVDQDGHVVLDFTSITVVHARTSVPVPHLEETR